MNMFGPLQLLFGLCIAAHLVISYQNQNLETVFEWKLLEYGFPTNRDQQQAIASGNLIAQNGIPIDVAPYYSPNRQMTFVTIPRFQTGIPYTLATVTQQRGANGPILMAYPSYDWHNNQNNCDGIISAFRVAITECNQMWVIDSGVIGSDQICPPQLLLFDLETDRLIHRYRFDSSIYTPRASLFITPIVVVKDRPPQGGCRETMVYICDVTYHGLVIYDYQQNTAWRAENRFMYPNPEFGRHSIAGEEFTLMDGIFGMTTNRRYLFFHPLASTSEFAVPLRVLNNRTNWEQSVTGVSPNTQQEFKQLGKRSSECAAEAIDSQGNIYCVTFKPINLFSWNVNSAYRPNNFRDLSSNQQSRLLEFVSGMKVVTNNVGKEELWLMSNKFQKISAATQNPNEVNFRILKWQIGGGRNGIETGDNLHNHLIFN